MSLVVSDTSPLRAICHLNEHSLLQRLFGEVLIPPAVAAELALPRGNSAAIHIADIPFIIVLAPKDTARVMTFRQGLDPGESEAIVLALETQAQTLLMDEAAGRAAARQVGLRCVGVMGVLGRAKREGMITEVRPRLDRLRHEIQFFIADDLYSGFLKSIGE